MRKLSLIGDTRSCTITYIIDRMSPPLLSGECRVVGGADVDRRRLAAASLSAELTTLAVIVCSLPIASVALRGMSVYTGSKGMSVSGV